MIGTFWPGFRPSPGRTSRPPSRILLLAEGPPTLAFTIIVLALPARSRSRRRAPCLFHDLGKLMLAFVMCVGAFQRLAAHHLYRQSP
jgi:hypothetical protein